MTQPLVSTGHLWFAAPNSFRWEIEKPVPTIAVRSEDEMWVIYPRLKRVEKYALGGGNMGQWKDALALLEAGFPRSEAELDRQFKVLSVTTTNAVTTVALQPRSAGSRRMMPQISLSFDATNAALVATELQFADGATMRNDFRNPIINSNVDRGLFHPALDPAFKVVEPMKRQ